MLLHAWQFPYVLRLTNILLYVYNTFLSTDGHRGCCFLALLKNAAMHIAYKYLFKFLLSILLSIHSEVELLDQIVFLCLMF